jgi:hypothetical protein
LAKWAAGQRHPMMIHIHFLPQGNGFKITLAVLIMKTGILSPQQAELHITSGGKIHITAAQEKQPT